MHIRVSRECGCDLEITFFRVISIEWQLVALKYGTFWCKSKYSSATSAVDGLQDHPSDASHALSPKSLK